VSNWLRRMRSWLLTARVLFITLSVILWFVAVLVLSTVTESHLRLTGLLLQLLGIATVLYGISNTRKLFGHPSLLAAALSWLRAFPKLHSGPVNIVGAGVLEDATAFGRATVRLQAGPNAGLEDRVRVLEENFKSIDGRATELQQQIDEAGQLVNASLSKERELRKRDVATLSKRLEMSETGGMDVSLMGLIWLMVGLVMSTASVELINFL